jgi:hypothetical protein
MTSYGHGGFAFRTGYGGSDHFTSQRAASEASSARNEARAATQEIERLLMITEALWLFLKEEHGYTDEDLIKKIAEIDIRDGRIDGRVQAEPSAPKDCPQCGRAVGKGRAACLYCATPVVRDPFER